jgi:hypothetical protein
MHIADRSTLLLFIGNWQVEDTLVDVDDILCREYPDAMIVLLQLNDMETTKVSRSAFGDRAVIRDSSTVNEVSCRA